MTLMKKMVIAGIICGIVAIVGMVEIIMPAVAEFLRANGVKGL